MFFLIACTQFEPEPPKPPVAPEETPAPRCLSRLLFTESPLYDRFEDALAAIETSSHTERDLLRNFTLHPDASPLFSLDFEIPSSSKSYEPFAAAYTPDGQHIIIATPERLLQLGTDGAIAGSVEMPMPQGMMRGRMLTSGALAPDPMGRWWVVSRLWSETLDTFEFGFERVDDFSPASAPTRVPLFPPAQRGAETVYGARFARLGRSSVGRSQRYLVWSDVSVGATPKQITHTVQSGRLDFAVDPPAQSLLPPMPADIKDPSPIDAYEGPNGELAVLWDGYISGNMRTYRVSLWDGERWRQLGSDLGTGLAPNDGSILFGDHGELLVAVVDTRGAKSKGRDYLLTVRRWDAASGEWPIVHRPFAGGLTYEAKSFKDAPVLWSQDGDVYLSWIEETPRDVYSTTDLMFRHVRSGTPYEKMRQETTHPRDLLLVRYDGQRWHDVGTERDDRRGLLPTSAMRFQYVVVPCPDDVGG